MEKKTTIGSHAELDQFLHNIEINVRKAINPEDFLFAKAIDRALWLRYKAQMKSGNDEARFRSTHERCPFGDPEHTGTMKMYQENLVP